MESKQVSISSLIKSAKNQHEWELSNQEFAFYCRYIGMMTVYPDHMNKYLEDVKQESQITEKNKYAKWLIEIIKKIETLFINDVVTWSKNIIKKLQTKRYSMAFAEADDLIDSCRYAINLVECKQFTGTSESDAAENIECMFTGKRNKQNTHVHFICKLPNVEFESKKQFTMQIDIFEYVVLPLLMIFTFKQEICDEMSYVVSAIDPSHRSSIEKLNNVMRNFAPGWKCILALQKLNEAMKIIRKYYLKTCVEI